MMKSIWWNRLDCHDLHHCLRLRRKPAYRNRRRSETTEGIEDVKVEVTWSPAWKITRISRYGRIALWTATVNEANHFLKIKELSRKWPAFWVYFLPDLSIFQNCHGPREAIDDVLFTEWHHGCKVSGKVVSALRFFSSSSDTAIEISLVLIYRNDIACTEVVPVHHPELQVRYVQQPDHKYHQRSVRLSRGATLVSLTLPTIMDESESISGIPDHP